jgi:K+-transporting ATPase ATPase B chain
MRETQSLFAPALLKPAVFRSFVKLDPRVQIRNPVMFVVYVGSIYCTVTLFLRLFAAQAVAGPSIGVFAWLTAWLWFTVLFANFAESIAEIQGKARADSLRAMRRDTMAKRLGSDGRIILVPAGLLEAEDRVACEAGDMIPADGQVVEGIATVDESAITGESAPVIRESGGDRDAVTGGTKVISDRIVVRITNTAGTGFLDRMISLIEGASRRKTPGETALTILLAALTLIFLAAVASLAVFAAWSSETAAALRTPGAGSTPTMIAPELLVALLVCLIPTTIGGLVSAIGISGIARLLKRNVIATSGRAVEAAGDVDVLLLDKTGTITLGNRMAVRFVPANGVTEQELAEAAQVASLADETPEGRSIVVLAKNKFGIRKGIERGERFMPFSAASRMSGVDFDTDAEPIRKGSVGAVRDWVAERGGKLPKEVDRDAQAIAGEGGTPLVVARGKTVLGVVQLKDIVKGGIRERFVRLRSMGIRTVMITGDNALTAAAIAAEAGVDDYVAEARPETKLERIRTEQAAGRVVAMIGDGTNDAPALAQADVGVAMAAGTQTAREAGNMVDFDNNPTKLLDIVETGKQLLMTRGALTTFSIANDVAKYFAILPALFIGLYAVGGKPGPLATLDIMGLGSPESAILSAVIFNALIIVALIPVALRGVPYKPAGADAVLARNLLVYGLGGLIVPFVGIKLIDLVLAAFGMA